MASIRMTILQALVTRLATISGFTVRLRDVELPTGNAPVVAVVWPVSEDKVLANSEAYDCTLQVGVWVTCRTGDADATLDGSNPFRYLDRLLTQVEAKIHAPDSWGINPSFTDVVVNGHDVDEVEGDQFSVDGFVRLTFTYRHHASSPEVA